MWSHLSSLSHNQSWEKWLLDSAASPFSLLLFLCCAFPTQRSRCQSRLSLFHSSHGHLSAGIAELSCSGWQINDHKWLENIARLMQGERSYCTGGAKTRINLTYHLHNSARIACATKNVNWNMGSIGFLLVNFSLKIVKPRSQRQTTARLCITKFDIWNVKEF